MDKRVAFRVSEKASLKLGGRETRKEVCGVVAEVMGKQSWAALSGFL